MPSIYRVISLSLVMSLFFAAPLLSIAPISTQLKKGARAAGNNGQPETVKVVLKRKSYAPHKRKFYAPHKRGKSAAWARVVHQSRKTGQELGEETWTPTGSTGEEVGSWGDEQRQGWDAAEETVGLGTATTGSHTIIHY